MWNAKLCLGTDEKFGLPINEQIKLFKQAGFEGFFTEWHPGDDIAGWKETGDAAGIVYQSIHAPFGRAADIWKNDGSAETAISELADCLKDCADNAVPIMVMHAFIGFNEHTPTKAGIENFKKIADIAGSLGVRLALENTEGEEYLAALMDSSASYGNVGFCWDSGHELCYNHSRDMLDLYGDRLLCTHLNDNLGIRDFGGEITWQDDLHLLPFDGVSDWKEIASRLVKTGYDGFLTFELCSYGKSDRHENDAYQKMPIEMFIAEAYKRACRVGTLWATEKAKTTFEQKL